MNTSSLAGLGAVALLAIGHFAFGYAWQDCWIVGLGLAVMVLASENNDLKHEISFLRDRVESLEDKVGHQWN
ncbi:hypothetical protein AB9F46_31535 [Rhizobium leguminosarum]|uniref:hypothetical protein n=1 Tax=Rhizobium leguminosarum TaxID=384 RepID=UPI003F9AD96F